MTDHPDDAARLREIQAREQAATAGPWVCSDRGDGSGSVYVAGDEGGTELLDDARCPYIRGEVRYEDGVFAAHARADIPWLLAQLTARETDGIEGLVRKWREKPVCSCGSGQRPTCSEGRCDACCSMRECSPLYTGKTEREECADELEAALVSRATRGGRTTTKEHDDDAR